MSEYIGRDFAEQKIDNSTLRRMKRREAFRSYAPGIAGFALVFGLTAAAAREVVNYFNEEALYADRLRGAKSGFVYGKTLGECVSAEVDANSNILRRMQYEALEDAIRARNAQSGIGFSPDGKPIRPVKLENGSVFPEPADGFIAIDGNGNGKPCR